MKPKVQVDPEFARNARRWYLPIRSIGQLMIVVALSGLLLWIVPMVGSECPVSLSPHLPLIPATITLAQGPAQNLRGSFSQPLYPGPHIGGQLDPVQRLRARADQPRDRFVIMARPELDAGMVIQARPDLDAGMVIDPDTHNHWWRVAPSVGGGPFLPGQGLVPVPDQGGPHWRDEKLALHHHLAHPGSVAHFGSA